MLKVLLVDDEPFILQGLSVLIDWEKEGFEIAGMVSNGEEAVAFLRDSEVDFIIADIKMPVMDGLTLLKTIRQQHVSEAFFVLLSGYGEFSYAKEAINYQCTDYILKPLQKSQLLALLERVRLLCQTRAREDKQIQQMGKACFVRHMQTLLLGRIEEESVAYVTERAEFAEGIRYIDIEPEDTQQMECRGQEEKRRVQREIYKGCLEYLGKEKELLVFLDAAGKEELFDVGFLFYKALAKEQGLREQEYLNRFLEFLQKQTGQSIVMYVGSEVGDVRDISESFRTAVVAKTFRNFKVMPSILYYAGEEENPSGAVVSRQTIEKLLQAVEETDKKAAKRYVAEIYEEMNRAGMDQELIQMNMNYLLYRLVQLAIEQDDSVNQDEILQYIRENAFDAHTIRGSMQHFMEFVLEYADYLGQLRRNVSRGVLSEVETEIREHYAQNITLKELGRKYFVNSAYLGQMFRKKYGMSFKDYLNNYRIERAAELLLRTDEKIYAVAEAVGYHDLDYFINRFIQSKGCTPTTYRKKVRI